ECDDVEVGGAGQVRLAEVDLHPADDRGDAAPSEVEGAVAPLDEADEHHLGEIRRVRDLEGVRLRAIHALPEQERAEQDHEEGPGRPHRQHAREQEEPAEHEEGHAGGALAVLPRLPHFDGADAEEDERPPAAQAVRAQDSRAVEGQDQTHDDEHEAERGAVPHRPRRRGFSHNASPEDPVPLSSPRRCDWRRITTPTRMRTTAAVCRTPHGTMPRFWSWTKVPIVVSTRPNTWFASLRGTRRRGSPLATRRSGQNRNQSAKMT